MKRDTRMGFEMYTIDLRKDGLLQRSTDWVKDNSLEILMLGLFIAMVYGVGLLMATTAEAVDLMSEYVDAEQELREDNYQLEQVVEALALQRAQERVEENAEQPPYWTAPTSY